MEDAFFNWLVECRKDNCLSDEEIEQVISSRRMAKDMLEDFLSNDSNWTIEWVRNQVKEFKQLEKCT